MGEGLDETLLDVIGILHVARLHSRAWPASRALARSSNPGPSWNRAQIGREAIWEFGLVIDYGFEP